MVVTKRTGETGSFEQTRFGTDAFELLPETLLPQISPEQAAYIVYTSGSTGVPKGVVVEHRNLMDIIRVLAPYAEGCQRVALVAPLSFDASIQQIAVSLCVGSSLYILSDANRKNPENFYINVCKNRLDLSDMTPAFFNVLVEYLFDHKLPLPIKKILLAGEILRPDVVQKFYSIAGNESVELYNVYGPTECTVDTSAFRIDYENHASFASFPIGRAFDGSVFTIRDKSGRPLPDSVKGEIWISGEGVSRGYLNVESADVFVTVEGDRCYKTGDYGFMQDGLAFYMGREDQQVKIRGNRVEIGEVERAIAGFPGVRQVAVVADTFFANEEKTLAAYIVGAVDPAALKGYLEQRVPQYCVPGHFVPMVELPLSINRKVDKKALPAPNRYDAEAAAGRAPEGQLEERLAEIWKKLLGFDIADAEADFFDLGGHSILAIRLIATMEKELGVTITLTELFTHSTITELASVLEEKTQSNNSPVIPLCRCEGGRTFSCSILSGAVSFATVNWQIF